MSRKLYRHMTGFFVTDEISQEQYNDLNRTQKKKYRQTAKLKGYKKIWNYDQE